MKSVFRKFLQISVLVFFDEILIYSSLWEAHVEHLQAVFSTLRSHNLHAKITKCEFGRMEIGYWGTRYLARGFPSTPTRSWPSENGHCQHTQELARVSWANRILQEICATIYFNCCDVDKTSSQRCFYLESGGHRFVQSTRKGDDHYPGPSTVKLQFPVCHPHGCLSDRCGTGTLHAHPLA